MIKILYTFLVCVIMTGCASQRNLQSDIGGHCVGDKILVGDFVKENKYVVQWIGQSSSRCPNANTRPAKIVPLDEYMPPTIYKQMVDAHEVNWGTIILLAKLEQRNLANIEANKENIRNCLIDDNYLSKSCLDKNISNDVYVNGYYRKDGTYVQGHYRSRPNGYKDDNYSYRGNVNPYTGKMGSQQ